MNEAGVISKEAMNDKHAWLFLRSRGVGGRVKAGQTLEASFSAVSTLNFAIGSSFESSRRDLYNAHLSTDLRSQMFVFKISTYRNISDFVV